MRKTMCDVLTQETRTILNSVPALIDKTFPIPGRFRSALPSHVAELSRLLTNKRGDRLLSYLGQPKYLGAYLHYFLPWNLYRLCFLLPGIDLKLEQGSIITDLGSGPLTFASALWIARPDLHKISLEINCIDRCAPALEAGKNFFSAISAGSDKDTPWKINLVREDIDLRRMTLHKAKKANLVCAVNFFNEIYEKIPHNNTEKLGQFASNAAQLMYNQAKTGALTLTVEPGVPQSGRFISLLRKELIGMGLEPVSPCTHTESCPMKTGSGTKRWCHFAFETESAPKELRSLSSAARLPKERLVLSYLLAGTEKAKSFKAASHALRVISDAFPLPQNRFGRYCCSAEGLVLLTGEKKRMEKLASGSLVTPNSSIQTTGGRDAKSGAIILEFLR